MGYGDDGYFFKTKIHILHSKNPYEQRLIIADADPAVKTWSGIVNELTYDGGILYGKIIVCDAPSIEIEFKKQ